MAVQLTEKAAEAVKRLHQETNQEPNTFLRLGLKPGGCGGLEYKIEFDKEFDDEKDSRYECHGVDVVVDRKSSLHLDGMTVEWYESLEKQGFTLTTRTRFDLAVVEVLSTLNRRLMHTALSGLASLE